MYYIINIKYQKIINSFETNNIIILFVCNKLVINFLYCCFRKRRNKTFLVSQKMGLDDQIGLFLLWLILLLYLISMIVRFSAPDLPYEAKYIEPHEMNNGDIVCVSYNNLAGAFVGSFTHSVWVHTGMIWVDPETEIRYVLEGAIYGQKEYQGFFKIPIVTWMNINRSNLMGYKKYHGPALDPDLMIKTFEPFIADSKLEGLNYSWIRFLYSSDYKPHKHKSIYTCFESTIILGQEIGTFARKKRYSSYFPKDLVNGTIHYNEGVYYSDTVQIHMNPCEKSLLFRDMGLFSSFWKK